MTLNRPQLQSPLSQHNAPSVVYPLGRSRLQGLLLLGFWFVGAAVVGRWLALSQAFGWQQGLGLLLLGAASFAAWAGWKNSAVGRLAWDGQVWRWESRGYQAGSAEHIVSVAFDGQALLLLRIDNPDQARLWLWAERRMCPERWMDLRRAVYSPHRDSNHQAITV